MRPSTRSGFYGAITALVTPFRNGAIDEKAFQELVEWQIKSGIHGLVPCGTTGESPTLSYEEHQRVIALCVEVSAGRTPVIAGTGSNSTDEAIMLSRAAEKAGVDGLLLVSPYYNKPTQEGIYAHFKAIHDASSVPIILYNIPGRSVVDMSDATIARLAELPRIVGLKDATGNLARQASLQQELAGREFDLFSGEDITAVGFNAQGGVGVISVAANIAPRQVVEIQDLTFAEKYKEAWNAQKKLIALHQILFCETNPAPTKYALSLLGKMTADLRLPLLLPSAANQAQIEAIMRASGIL